MYPYRRIAVLCIHVLVIVAIVGQQLILPLEAWAHPTMLPEKMNTNLIREKNETVDDYLERVAKIQPELLQQAALASIQDVFNGKIPDSPGDKALEEQIANYINQAATGRAAPPQIPQNSTSSTVEGDVYRWNAARYDEQGQGGSSWDITTRPGGDTQAFAQQFEELMNPAMLPSSLPVPEEASPAVAENEPSQALENEIIKPPNSTAISYVAPPFISKLLLSSDLPESQPHLKQLLSNNQDLLIGESKLAWVGTKPTIAHQSIPAPIALQQTVSHIEADLGLSMSVTSVITYDGLLTYTFIISNSGPGQAQLVQLTQNLPANGVYQNNVAACFTSDEQVVCKLGKLAANVSTTVNILVQMKGNGLVTSTAKVVDSEGTIDPGGQSHEAKGGTTVISPTSRMAYKVGKIFVAANFTETIAGQTKATGAVELAYQEKDSDPITYHLHLGPNDFVTWGDSDTKLSGKGTVFQIKEDYKLFRGDFGTVDANIIPAKNITQTFKDISGFTVVSNSAVITQVSLIDGAASISATIKFSQPGIDDKNTQSMVGAIKAGGKVEGNIKKFSMLLAGVKIEVDKATLAKDTISVENAKLSMPNDLGGLTGILSEMKITAKNITLGGAAVKIPMPNIYPAGKPTTATLTATTTTTSTEATTPTVTTISPTIAIISNSATIGIFKDEFRLLLEGTLQLNLPNNQKDVPIEFQLRDSGLVTTSVQLTGTVKRINLNVAGSDLLLEEVALGNSGLRVERAVLTYTWPSGKTEAKKSEETKSRARAADDKKTEGRQTAVIVKKVVIDGDGLKIGGAGITNYLPDYELSKVAVFNKMALTVEGNKSPTGKIDFELAISGVLNIDFSPKVTNTDSVTSSRPAVFGQLNVGKVTGTDSVTDTEPITNTEAVTNAHKQTIKFKAKIDKDGKFSGELDQITIIIANCTLEMKKIAFDSKGLTAGSATLTLPELLNKTKVFVNKVKIDSNGLSFGDAGIKIPVEFTIGNPENANNLAVKGNLTLIISKDRTYGFEVEGKVTIKLASQTVEATGKFRIDHTKAMRGSVDSFKLIIAGLELAIKSAKVDGSTLMADDATLSIPPEWGGLSVTVNQVKVSKDGFSIGGGSFKLPEIKVGGIILSLEGTLKKEGNNYVIGAGGTFKMPNVGGSGCSGLGVKVELYATETNRVAMRIEPMSEKEARGYSFKLRQIGVSLQCTIPIGTSGFDLTEVAGTVTLSDNTTKVNIKVKIESKLKVGSFNVMTGNGDMDIDYVKNPYKFEIGLGASLKIFSMFEAAKARVAMRFADGDVPFIFKAEMNIDAIIAKGEVKLTAWTKNGDFHMVGRVYGQVGARRGALVDKCVGRSWWRICITLPTSDIFISANMEMGEFKRNGGSQWGLKAEIEFFGQKYGAYVDTGGTFSLGNVSEYQTIDAPKLRRARWVNEQVSSGRMSRESLKADDLLLLNGYRFAKDKISIDVATITRPSDLGVILLRTEADADVTVTLVRPDGLGITGINPPSNVTFNETKLNSSQIAKTDTGQVIPNENYIQTFMAVTNAQFGKWQVILSRQPTNEFLLYVDGTVYGPPVEKLALINQPTVDNQVQLSWTQTANISTTVSIYATQDAMTTTASYTDTQQVARANGLTATEVVTVDVGTVTQFGGYPVATFNYTATGKTALTKKVDLSFLRSGTYNLWLEVNDGLNPPTRRYFPGAATVWHDWSNSWQANMQVTPEQGGLTVGWAEHPNADVDGYKIQVVSPDLADEDSFTLDAGQSLSQTITGLTANKNYSVTVIAYDTGTERTAESETMTASPLHAPFNVTASPQRVTVAGGQSANVLLKISSAISPYPDVVFLDAATSAPDFDLMLTTDLVTPTVTGIEAGLIITPSATLPSGVYTVTLLAMTASEVKEIEIPITVQEPAFTLQASRNDLTLYKDGVVSMTIQANYQFGETDEIEVSLENAPVGLEWSFEPSSFAPDGQATLILTNTDYLALGNYQLTIWGTDNENEQSLDIPLTVADFNVEAEENSWAAQNGEAVTYTIDLAGVAWSNAVELSFDATSLANYFVVEINSNQATVPAKVTAQVTVLPDTPAGFYELLLNATSQGQTETLPLYLTVQDIVTATDLQLNYVANGAVGEVVAGEIYSYTLKPRNLSANLAPDVMVVDSVSEADYLTLIDGDGCTANTVENQTNLTCAFGDIPAYGSPMKTILWRVNADAPVGLLLTHRGEVIFDNTLVTETGTLNNETDYLVNVRRVSDLVITAQADKAVAGTLLTYTAVVTNDGPSYADDTVVDIFLPDGVDLVSTSAGCVQAVELVTCNIGSLTPTANKLIMVTVMVNSDLVALPEATFIASSASNDELFSNNYAFVAPNLETQANLTVNLAPDRVKAVEGETVDYWVNITNQGPSVATNINVDLLMPDSSDIVDIKIGDMTRNPDELTLKAGESMTMVVSTLFKEDSDSKAVSIAVEAQAADSAVVQAHDQSLMVSNAVPTVTLTNTLTVNEGEWGVLTVAAEDAAGEYDPLTIEWDLNNDGFFDDANGGIIRFDARNLDGPMTRPIAVRVMDDDGGEVIRTGTVMIQNIAPMVDIGADQYRPYNQPFAVGVEYIDPMQADIQKATVDWGDGTVVTLPLQARTSLAEVTHSYNKVAKFTVNACVTDDNGAQQCDQMVAQAACQEHGLVAHFSTINRQQVVINLENATGNVTIPAKLPVTLYNGAAALQTFTLDRDIAVGSAYTLTYRWTTTPPDSYQLRFALDDAGTGAKTTSLCSGSVTAPNIVTVIKSNFLPIVVK